MLFVNLILHSVMINMLFSMTMWELVYQWQIWDFITAVLWIVSILRFYYSGSLSCIYIEILLQRFFELYLYWDFITAVLWIVSILVLSQTCICYSMNLHHIVRNLGIGGTLIRLLGILTMPQIYPTTKQNILKNVCIKMKFENNWFIISMSTWHQLQQEAHGPHHSPESPWLIYRNFQ
jgi:hypothetical protein